jgi:hypothetical protein
MKYTMSKDLSLYPYHLEIISKKLTQRLTTVLPEVVEEVAVAFEENVNIGAGLFLFLCQCGDTECPQSGQQ